RSRLSRAPASAQPPTARRSPSGDDLTSTDRSGIVRASMTVRARLAVVLGAAVAALAAGGGAAVACTNIHLGVTTPTVGPGGTIRFTISNLVAGATWTVGLAGGETVSGVASQDGAVSASVAVPDLGSSSRM